MVAIEALATVVETGRDPDSLTAVVLDSAMGVLVGTGVLETANYDFKGMQGTVVSPWENEGDVAASFSLGRKLLAASTLSR